MKDIKNYEGLYAITSCGKVWSYKNQKFLKPHDNGRGYQIVFLCKNGITKVYKVHRLVAEAYIPNLANLPCINHKDECKEHNYINNLEWCDHKYNNNYGNRNAKVSAKLAKRVRCIETGEIFNSLKEASIITSTHMGNISSAITGRRKTAGGYHWEFI